MPSPVKVVVKQTFPVPPAPAYAWLTDIQDDDTERTHAVIAARKVRERAPGRIVYEGETVVLGQRNWSVTDVTLRPPDRWEARVIEGPRTGSVTDYVLEEKAGGCELTVTYRFVLANARKMLLLRLAKPLVRRDLQRMWAGYAEDMAREMKVER